MTEARLNRRRRKFGIVTSDRMQKTIVVQSRRRKRHPLLGKVIERAVRFKTHDEKNEAKIGDVVEIQETRPLSKDKRWRLVRIISRGTEAAAELPEASS